MLLEIVLSTLGGVCDPVILSTRRGLVFPEPIASQEIVYDRTPDRGPLEGLIIGLRHLQNRSPYAFVCGCDSPYLVPDVISLLVDLATTSNANAIIPSDSLRAYPLCAVYRTSFAETLEELQRKTSRLQAICDLPGVQRIATEALRQVDPELRSLVNLNTPKDLPRT